METPTIRFMPLAWAKLRAFSAQKPGLECSGMGLVDAKDPLLVVDYYPVEQVCTASATVMGNAALGKLMYELDVAGIDPGRLRLWHHTHARFDVFWSSTDDATIDKLGAGEGHFLSVVTNSAGKVLCRVDFWTPIRAQITADWGIEIPDVTEWAKEAGKKITEEKLPPVVNRYPPGIPALPGTTSKQARGGIADFASRSYRNGGRFDWAEDYMSGYVAEENWDTATDDEIGNTVATDIALLAELYSLPESEVKRQHELLMMRGVTHTEAMMHLEDTLDKREAWDG